MLKKKITYTDFDGVERTEDFYFNLTKAEVLEMELGTSGGYAGFLNRITMEKDIVEMAKHFKTLILKSYGKKSPDGKRFIKSEEISAEFAQTEAFSELYVELATDDEAAWAFVEGVFPKDLNTIAEKLAAKNAGGATVVPLTSSAT